MAISATVRPIAMKYGTLLRRPIHYTKNKNATIIKAKLASVSFCENSIYQNITPKF